MKDDQTKWIPTAKSASIQKWTDQLHKEAKRVFVQDGTHVHIMLSFNDDDGLISVNPIPPKIDQAQLNGSITNAIQEHSLYAVIFIGEAWVYFPKEKDHTAFQLLDGEMKVSDLNDDDKVEVLIVQMESRDGDSLICLDKIVRDSNSVKLGEGKTIRGEERKWFN